MISFLLLLFKFSDSTQCNSPNTKLNASNKCVCIDGFPFGDPNSNEGCFKCDQKCHNNSICKYPGKCVCISPYFGDGVSNCDVCQPHLYFISPNSGPAQGGTAVQIQYNCPATENIPNVAYCKFGTKIEKSVSVTNSTITCLTPKHESVPTLISISFDSITWSQENVFFNFIDFFFEDEDNDYDYDDEYTHAHENQNQNINYTEQFPTNYVFLITLAIVFISLFLFLFLSAKNNFHNNELPFALRKAQKD